MILSLVIGIFTVRYLGPGNYGVISYIESFVMFFTAVSTLGLNAIIIKEFVSNEKQQGKLLGTALILRIVVGCISSILLILIIFLTGEGDKELIIVACIQSLIIPFQAFELINFWFQSKMNSKKAVIAQVYSYIILIVYKTFILITGKSILWFAFSTTLDIGLAGLMLFIAYVKNEGPKLEFSLFTAKKLLSQSYHFIFSSMLVVIYAQTDKIMIKYFMDVYSVGIYSAALKITIMWSFIPYAIIDSARPLIMSAKEVNTESYEKKLIQLYAVIIWLSILYGIFVCFFAKNIILILYGNEYIGATSALQILVWYTAASFIGSIKNIWLICENKIKFEKYFALMGVICNIMLNLILIPYLGIVGAAIASLGTQFVTNIFAPLLFPETRGHTKLVLEGLFLKRILWN
ncbi:flippase [Planococcus sp. ANT_H30]|nr:flippase [Planococcus sp. ANT_H30]